MKRRPRRRLPSHYLADTAVQAVAQGGISATDQAVLYELIRQHGPWLDRRRPLHYRLIGSRIGRSHRTIVRATQSLRRAGLLQVDRRWEVVAGQVRQLPPLYRFPALAGPTPPALLRLQAGQRLPHIDAIVTPTNQTMQEPSSSKRSATGEGRVSAQTIREYGRQLAKRKAAPAVEGQKGRPASGGDPPAGPEGDPSG